MPHEGAGAAEEELYHRVADIVAEAATPEQAAAALTAQPDIEEVWVRPGLVKTEPPLVELVVEQREGTDAVSRRVYDVAVSPDAGLELRGVHDD